MSTFGAVLWIFHETKRYVCCFAICNLENAPEFDTCVWLGYLAMVNNMREKHIGQQNNK